MSLLVQSSWGMALGAGQVETFKPKIHISNIYHHDQRRKEIVKVFFTKESQLNFIDIL